MLMVHLLRRCQMNNKLEVYYKNVWGNDLCYPVNDIAKNICKLTGAKTLSDHALSIAKDMGYIKTPVAYDPTKHYNISEWNKKVYSECY